MAALRSRARDRSRRRVRITAYRQVFARTREGAARLVEAGAPATVAIAELVSSGAERARGLRRRFAAGGAGQRRHRSRPLQRRRRADRLPPLRRRGDRPPAGSRGGRPGPDRLRARWSGSRSWPPTSSTSSSSTRRAARPTSCARACRAPGDGAGFLHALWTDAEREFAAQALAEQWATREGVAATYRALRQTGDARGGRLREALAGRRRLPALPRGRAPAASGSCASSGCCRERRKGAQGSSGSYPQ